MITQKLQLKILPDSFEKALNSNDRTTSRAYQQWRQKDFADWATVGEIETEWKKDNPRYSEKEWLKIFPEAEPYLKSRLKELEKEHANLELDIGKSLLKIYQVTKDDFSIWFLEKIVEIWEGERLNKVSKDIRRIKWALSPDDVNNTNEKPKITNEMIWRAKEYPFEQLIDFNRAKKALCVFHNEKNPSLSLNQKTNRIKCFACGISLDPIGYIMKTQGLSFIEAVKYLNN